MNWSNREIVWCDCGLCAVTTEVDADESCVYMALWDHTPTWVGRGWSLWYRIQTAFRILRGGISNDVVLSKSEASKLRDALGRFVGAEG